MNRDEMEELRDLVIYMSGGGHMSERMMRQLWRLMALDVAARLPVVDGAAYGTEMAERRTVPDRRQS